MQKQATHCNGRQVITPTLWSPSFPSCNVTSGPAEEGTALSVCGLLLDVDSQLNQEALPVEVSASLFFAGVSTVVPTGLLVCRLLTSTDESIASAARTRNNRRTPVSVSCFRRTGKRTSGCRMISGPASKLDTRSENSSAGSESVAV